MQPLNVGIIGFGRIGAEHAAWISTTTDVRVGAVFDPTPTRRALAASRGFATVDTLESLLTSESIDAVLVSTPTSMHYEPASAALRAGKHVMVEKPITLDLPQAQQLDNLAHSLQRVLSVFHCRRWDIDFLTVKELIASGRLGKVINIESRLGQFASCVGPAAKDYRPGWRNEQAFGGGGLYDWGSHFVDQIWQLLLPANPIRVFAQLRGNVWTSDCDDFARVLIDFDNGAVAMVEINTTTNRPQARWHIDGAQASASSPPSPAFDTHVWADLTLTDAIGQSHSVERASPGLTEAHIWSAFAVACRTGTAPAVEMGSVLKTMKLLDAARESSRLGVAVPV